MVFNSIVKVKGVPFVDTTKCIQIFDIIVKDKDMIVIEIDNNTPDVPYGECFHPKEVWIAVQSDHNNNLIIFGK
jgi:hypothetical protein